MTRRFDDVIEVGHLPAPVLVEALEPASINARLVGEYRSTWPDWEDETEFEPVRAHLRVDAYESFLLRARINHAAGATQLALAEGADLDIHGWGRNVTRKLLVPEDLSATPPQAAVWEEDGDYRERIQLAPESWSVAGPEGAYVFFARTVPGVADAVATSPAPAEALITVMAETGDGTADAALLAAVDTALDRDTVVPLSDRVTVQSVSAVAHHWEATLFLKPGSDAGLVEETVLERARAFAAASKRIGVPVEPVQAFGALAVPGVVRAEHSLSDGLAIGPLEVAAIDPITFLFEVLDE